MQINKLRQEIEEMRIEPSTKNYQYTNYEIKVSRKSILIWEAEAKLQGYQLAVEDFEKFIDERIKLLTKQIISNRENPEIRYMLNGAKSELEELKSKVMRNVQTK